MPTYSGKKRRRHRVSGAFSYVLFSLKSFHLVGNNLDDVLRLGLYADLVRKAVAETFVDNGLEFNSGFGSGLSNTSTPSCVTHRALAFIFSNNAVSYLRGIVIPPSI